MANGEVAQLVSLQASLHLLPAWPLTLLLPLPPPSLGLPCDKRFVCSNVTQVPSFLFLLLYV